MVSREVPRKCVPSAGSISMSCRLTVESSMTHHETSMRQISQRCACSCGVAPRPLPPQVQDRRPEAGRRPFQFWQSHHFKVHQLDEKTKHGTAKQHAQHCIMMLEFIIFVLAEHHMNLFPVASKSLSAQPPPSHDVGHLPLFCRRVEACLAA